MRELNSRNSVGWNAFEKSRVVPDFLRVDFLHVFGRLFYSYVGVC